MSEERLPQRNAVIMDGTRAVTCPACGYEYIDSWAFFLPHGSSRVSVACHGCGIRIHASAITDVTYTTWVDAADLAAGT